MVAFAAATAPGGFGWDGAPVEAHRVEGVDKSVVFSFRSAVGHDSVGAAPDGEPGEVEEGECVGAVHGGDETALAKFGVEAGDVEHLGQVGTELEGVESDGAVERVGGVRGR